MSGLAKRLGEWLQRTVEAAGDALEGLPRVFFPRPKEMTSLQLAEEYRSERYLESLSSNNRNTDSFLSLVLELQLRRPGP